MEQPDVTVIQHQAIQNNMCVSGPIFWEKVRASAKKTHKPEEKTQKLSGKVKCKNAYNL